MTFKTKIAIFFFGKNNQKRLDTCTPHQSQGVVVNVHMRRTREPNRLLQNLIPEQMSLATMVSYSSLVRPHQHFSRVTPSVYFRRVVSSTSTFTFIQSVKSITDITQTIERKNHKEYILDKINKET